MNISEILKESPYLLSGDHYDPSVEYFNNISDNALQREYYRVGEFPINIGNSTDILEFHLLKSDRSVMLGTVTGEKHESPTNVILARLEFKDHMSLKKTPDGIDHQTLKQVGSVYISPRLRNLGIASFMYIIMLKLGYVIISDRDQFEPGKQLWKRMARESLHGNYVIRIVTDAGEFLKDSNGNVISYDDSNIAESKIWSSGEDMTGEHILLMMKHKEK